MIITTSSDTTGVVSRAFLPYMPKVVGNFSTIPSICLHQPLTHFQLPQPHQCFALFRTDGWPQVAVENTDHSNLLDRQQLNSITALLIFCTYRVDYACCSTYVHLLYHCVSILKSFKIVHSSVHYGVDRRDNHLFMECLFPHADDCITVCCCLRSFCNFRELLSVPIKCCAPSCYC